MTYFPREVVVNGQRFAISVTIEPVVDTPDPPLALSLAFADGQVDPGDPFTLTATATGGDGTYDYAVSVDPAVSLNVDGGTVTGTAPATVSETDTHYTFTVTVTSGGQSVTRTATLVVSGTPVVEPGSPPDAVDAWLTAAETNALTLGYTALPAEAVTSYRFAIQPTGGAESASTHANPVNPFRFGNLTPDTEYTLTVSAINEHGEGPRTTVVARTAAVVPEPTVNYQLAYSTNADMSAWQVLEDGLTTDTGLAIFLIPTEGVTSVDFYVNGSLLNTQATPPLVLNGDAAGLANLWQPAPGTYELSATVHTAGGDVAVPAVTVVVEEPAEPPPDPDPEPGGGATLLFRWNLDQGLAGVNPDASTGTGYTAFPTVAGSMDPTGKAYAATVPSGSGNAGPKIRTKFSQIGLAARQECYFSCWVTFPAGWNVDTASTTKQGWGLGGIPSGASGWYTSAGGAKKPDSWSLRFCTIPANYLAWRIGSHPFTYLAYIYAEHADGQELSEYGIEAPFRIGSSYFTPPRGTRFHLQGRVKMNTPGQNNGIVEAWVGSTKWLSVTDVRWCDNGNDVPINQIVSETFTNSPTNGGTVLHENLILTDGLWTP